MRVKVSSEVLYNDTISPMIYGEFIEFLNDLLPGMRAEKIQDRSFEGVLQPNCLWPPDDNWVYPRWRSIAVGTPCFDRWPGSHEDSNMVNTSAHFELDQEAKFVGSQSAKVTVAKGNDGKPFMAGISQDNIAVKQGEKLNVEALHRVRPVIPSTMSPRSTIAAPVRPAGLGCGRRPAGDVDRPAPPGPRPVRTGAPDCQSRRAPFG